MQARWANLLANAAVRERALPHVAFPEILKQLSAIEDSMLDAMYLELSSRPLNKSAIRSRGSRRPSSMRSSASSPSTTPPAPPTWSACSS